MSTAARWSLRLPRSTPRSLSSRLPRYVSQRTAEQKRWLRVRPSRPQKPNQQSAIPPQPQNDYESRQGSQEEVGRNTQLSRTLSEADSSDLVTSVNIPDDPYGVLPPGHPAFAVLGNSSLVIQRQLELMNVMLGFEQANRYIIMDGQGQTLGYIAEQDHGLGTAMARQMFRTHRSFTTHIFDSQEREILRIHRPFAYINSRIRIYDPVPESGYDDIQSTNSPMNQGSMAQVSPLKLEEMRIIGEAQQQWAPLRRKYNLFSYRALRTPPENDQLTIESGERPTSDTTALTERSVPEQEIEAGMAQFAHVDEPFLSWDFTLRGEEQQTIGSVNRNFGGFAREIFTDTGVYALRMDSAAQIAAVEATDGTELSRSERAATAMTLDQRAVMLATAVSIDFDYFSRHSGVGHGGFMPVFWPMGAGGAAAEGGAVGAGTAGGVAAGEAGAVGAGTAGAAEAAGGAVTGAAGRGLGTGAGAAAESGIAGAGTMAGYEAMQRGVYGSRGQDDASPQANEPFVGDQNVEQMENRPGNDEVWGEDQDPWGGGNPPSSGGTEGGGGGGWMDTLSDFFNGD